MIIFNLWAIPVAIVIYLILLGLERVWPAVMTEPRSGWTIGIVATLVGAVCDRVGIKARVFFLPIWMLGLGIICYHLGWPGTIAFIALLVGGGIWFFKAGKKQELSNWQKAQEELARTGAPPADADESQFWTWVKATLFLPIWLDLTPDLCQHDAKVLRVVQQCRPPLTPDELAKVQVLEQFLTQAQAASKPPGSELKIQNPVADLVEQRLSRALKAARRQKLSAPPAAAATAHPERYAPS